MEPNGISVESLQKKLDRQTRWIVIGLGVSWLFVALCFYLSLKTGSEEWFARSGSVMCLLGAAGAFRFANRFHQVLRVALKEHLLPLEANLAFALKPSKRYQLTTY